MLHLDKWCASSQLPLSVMPLQLLQVPRSAEHGRLHFNVHGPIAFTCQHKRARNSDNIFLASAQSALLEVQVPIPNGHPSLQWRVGNAGFVCGVCIVLSFLSRLYCITLHPATRLSTLRTGLSIAIAKHVTRSFPVTSYASHYIRSHGLCDPCPAGNRRG